MKKILFLLFIGFLSIKSFGQKLTFPNWEDTIVGTTNEQEITSHSMQVVNTSSGPLTLMVQKNVITRAGGSGFYFCWGTACEDTTANVSSQSVTINVGDTNVSFINYCVISFDNNNAGLSQVEYCFYESGGGGLSVCVDQYYDVQSVSSAIENKSSNDRFEVVSASGMLIVSMVEMTGPTDVEIYDINGKMVTSKVSNGADQVVIDTNELKSAVYIVKVVNEGSVVGNKKIMLLQ